MPASDWSNTTQELLKTSNIPDKSEISWGSIRAAIGRTDASIGASEWHRVTDLDAPYNFPNNPTTSVPHLPYLMDATENAHIPTSGEISPNDIKDVIKEYKLEQDPSAMEENLDAGTLVAASMPTAGVNWNSNLNKNITKYLKIRGKVVSPTVATPAISIGSSASSNLNIYVTNSPAGLGVMGAGGAKGVSSGQPGGHAISITNPSAPATRVVYVECEGNESKIWGGGGGGYDGVNGVDGVDGNAPTANGSDGQDGQPGSPGSSGSPGGSGSSGSPGQGGGSGQPGQSGSPGQQTWISYTWNRAVQPGQSRSTSSQQRCSRRREWWSRYPNCNTSYSQNRTTFTSQARTITAQSGRFNCAGGSAGSGGGGGSGGSGGGGGSGGSGGGGGSGGQGGQGGSAGQGGYNGGKGYKGFAGSGSSGRGWNNLTDALQSSGGTPGTPGTPGGAGTPGTGGTPGTPGTPGGGGQPGTPGGSGTPGGGGGGGTPGGSGQCGSATPGTPGTPGGGGTPGTPGSGGGKGGSGQPGSSGTPGTPGTPGGNGQPGTPGTPGQPGVAGGDWGMSNAGGGSAGRAVAPAGGKYTVIPNGGDIRVIY